MFVTTMKQDQTEIDTKTKILIAAKDIFVKHGYSGASISKIASTANVNHSLIFHHFKNKKTLWAAVKAYIVSKASSKKTNLGTVGAPYRDFLMESANNMVSFFKENKDIRQLLNWQRVDKDDYDTGEVVISEELEKWISAFEYYQSRGDISKTVNISFLLQSFFSLISNISMDPRVLDEVESDMDAYLCYCVDMVLRASDNN